MKQTFHVFRHGDAAPAGEFVHEAAHDVGEFTYTAEAIANGVSLDPVNLPVSKTTAYTEINAGLFGAFLDACPDTWGRTVLARKLQKHVADLTIADVLTQRAGSGVGNLVFSTTPVPPGETPTPALKALNVLMQAAAEVEEGRDDIDPVLLAMLTGGSTLGGARPKVNVVDESGVSWLAKLSRREDTFNHPQVEHACLALARKAGLNVVDHRVHAVGDTPVLLVKRFDRIGERRMGFISALTVFGVDQDRWQGLSYLTLAQYMRRFGQGSDLSELYGRMAFNLAVRNTDDHARNHGFLLGGKGLVLSPLYDVVPDDTFLGVASAPIQQALSIGLQGRAASIDNLLSGAAHFGLSEDAARQIIGRVGRAVATHWQSTLRESGVDEADVTRLAPAFRLAEAMAVLDASDDYVPCPVCGEAPCCCGGSGWRP